MNRREYLKTAGIASACVAAPVSAVTMTGGTITQEGNNTTNGTQTEGTTEVGPGGITSELEVMTYNIHHGEGADGVYDLRRSAGEIWATDPDIVGLQELDWNFLFEPEETTESRSNFDRQIKLLAEWLEMDYAFAANLNLPPIDASDGQPRRYGIGVLSKHPILETTHAFLPKIEYEDQYSEQRGLLGTRINVNGTMVWFYNTHMGLTEEQRIRQMDEILNAVEGQPDPKFVVGDFNAEPGSAPYEAINSEYVDVLGELGETDYTFPAPYLGETEERIREDERVRIDYIFSSAGVEPLRGRIKQTIASDHLPVQTTVGISGIDAEAPEPIENPTGGEDGVGNETGDNETDTSDTGENASTSS